MSKTLSDQGHDAHGREMLKRSDEELIGCINRAEGKITSIECLCVFISKLVEQSKKQVKELEVTRRWMVIVTIISGFLAGVTATDIIPRLETIFK